MTNLNNFVIKHGVLKKYVPRGGDVVVPDGVTSIGEGVFCGKSITSITFPNGLKSIERLAFNKCELLTEVSFPDSVTRIEDSAFEDCKKLKRVNIPSSLKSIGNCAFGNCKKLTDLDLRGSGKRISASAFYGCKGLADKDGFVIIQNNLFDYFGKNEDVVIPDNVKTVSGYAFEANKIIRSISASHKFTFIPLASFKSCSKLESVYLPFANCVYGMSTFYNCRSLVEITIPDFEDIGSSFFEGCASLTSYVMSPQVRSVSSEVFKSCTSLKSITLSNKLRSIHETAFKGCNSLTEFLFPEDCVFYVSYLEKLWECIKKTEYKNAFLHSCLKYGFDKVKNHPFAKTIKNHKDSIVLYILEQTKDAEVLKNLLSLFDRISVENLEKYMSIASADNSVELKSVLLNEAKKAFHAANEFDLLKEPTKKKMPDPKRKEAIKKQVGIEGIAFVATGDFENFGFFDEYTGAHDLSDLKEYIEARGGFLRSAVSSKTDYLICNDPKSRTVKSKKAAELGIEVITEETFLEMANRK